MPRSPCPSEYASLRSSTSAAAVRACSAISSSTVLRFPARYPGTASAGSTAENSLVFSCTTSAKPFSTRLSRTS